MNEEEEPAMSNTMMEMAAENIARSLEEQINESNMWDMPATLWNITMEDMPEGFMEFLMENRENLEDALIERRSVELRPEETDLFDMIAGDKPLTFGMAFLPELVEYLEGHPYDALIGRRAEPHVLGACLMTEGWDYSDENKERFKNGEKLGFQPSEDPGRRELRMAHLLWKDGTECMVQRHRDTDEVVCYVTGQENFSLGGRIIAALRLYLGRPSAMTYETSAYDAARAVWALGLIHSGREVGEGLKAAADDGRNVVEELKERMVETGMPTGAVDAFVENPIDSLILVGVRSHPSTIMERAPSPTATLSVVFDDCPNLADYEADNSWDDFNQLLGGVGPKAGSDEDVALWDKARQLQADKMQEMFDGLEEHFAEKGKRDIMGIPGPLVKEKMIKRITMLRWMDGPLFAYTADGELPTAEWIHQELDKMVDDGTITQDTADLIRTCAGLEV